MRIKAVITNGAISPLGALPSDWKDGTPLTVDSDPSIPPGTESRPDAVPKSVWIPALVCMAALITFFMIVMIAVPTMTSQQQEIGRSLFALLAGFSAGFMGGTALFVLRWPQSDRVKFAFSATAGIAVFSSAMYIAPYWHRANANARRAVADDVAKIAAIPAEITEKLTPKDEPAVVPSILSVLHPVARRNRTIVRQVSELKRDYEGYKAANKTDKKKADEDMTEFSKWYNDLHASSNALVDLFETTVRSGSANVPAIQDAARRFIEQTDALSDGINRMYYDPNELQIHPPPLNNIEDPDVYMRSQILAISDSATVLIEKMKGIQESERKAIIDDLQKYRLQAFKDVPKELGSPTQFSPKRSTPRRFFIPGGRR